MGHHVAVALGALNNISFFGVGKLFHQLPTLVRHLHITEMGRYEDHLANGGDKHNLLLLPKEHKV